MGRVLSAKLKQVVNTIAFRRATKRPEYACSTSALGKSGSQQFPTTKAASRSNLLAQLAWSLLSNEPNGATKAVLVCSLLAASP